MKCICLILWLKQFGRLSCATLVKDRIVLGPAELSLPHELQYFSLEEKGLMYLVLKCHRGQSMASFCS